MNTCPASRTQTTAAGAIERPRVLTDEDENGYLLRIALPGVRKEDLKLTLRESNLQVEAARGDANDPPRRYGLNIRLTSRYDGSLTTAKLDAGVLTLQVPIREESKPRRIEVN